MAVPKRRKSMSKRDSRRAQQHKIAAVHAIDCPNCAEKMQPHRICPSCGHYKGREVKDLEGEA